MLSGKQKRVAKAVFEGQGLAEIRRKNTVSYVKLEEWRKEGEFQEEVERLCQEAERETRRIVSRFGPIAALRLAELAGSEKAEVARRAALDLVQWCLRGKAKGKEEAGEMPEEEARQMLARFAEGYGKEEQNTKL